MKLDSEDYENIYLRVREKLWLFWAGLLTVIGGVGLIVLYITLSEATEKAVNKYIQSAGLARSLSTETSNRLADLERREASLQQAIKRFEEQMVRAAALPISISPAIVTLASATGEQFYVERGTGAGGAMVRFSAQFKKPPFVLVAAVADKDGTPVNVHPLLVRQSREAVAIVSDVNGFQLPRPGSMRAYYTWLAVGQ